MLFPLQLLDSGREFMEMNVENCPDKGEKTQGSLVLIKLSKFSLVLKNN